MVFDTGVETHTLRRDFHLFRMIHQVQHRVNNDIGRDGIYFIFIYDAHGHAVAVSFEAGIAELDRREEAADIADIPGEDAPVEE
jgi:hypothetical protein